MAHCATRNTTHAVQIPVQSTPISRDSSVRGPASQSQSARKSSNTYRRLLRGSSARPKRAKRIARGLSVGVLALALVQLQLLPLSLCRAVHPGYSHLEIRVLPAVGVGRVVEQGCNLLFA